MNTKITFVIITASAMSLAGCASHHHEPHHEHHHQPSSFRAYMKANDAANTSNIMKITPIKLPAN